MPNKKQDKTLTSILIAMKVNRTKVKMSKSLGGPAYDAFSDAVTDLYAWLDLANIDRIEKSTKGSR